MGIPPPSLYDPSTCCISPQSLSTLSIMIGIGEDRGGGKGEERERNGRVSE